MTIKPSNGTAVPSTVTFASMTQAHEGDVLALQARVFGPGRFVRTAFRLRETAAPLLSYSRVAEENGRLIGAVSMSRIMVGDVPGVLLGPLAVLTEKRDLGVGKALLQDSVAEAFKASEPFVLLVGDLPYYAPVGFLPAPFGTIIMPGPVDPARLLIAHNPDVSTRLSGKVVGAA